jgi:HNH endonuclease
MSRSPTLAFRRKSGAAAPSSLINSGSHCSRCKRRNGSTRRWRNTRARVRYRDRWTCQRCGALATHVDHVVPLLFGGADDERNLQALCEHCNLSKARPLNARQSKFGSNARQRPSQGPGWDCDSTLVPAVPMPAGPGESRGGVLYQVGISAIAPRRRLSVGSRRAARGHS